MEEKIAGGQVRGVGRPVFALPSPAGEDPGTKDPINEVHAVVGSVDSSTVLKKYSKLRGKASQGRLLFPGAGCTPQSCRQGSRKMGTVGTCSQPI